MTLNYFLALIGLFFTLSCARSASGPVSPVGALETVSYRAVKTELFERGVQKGELSYSYDESFRLKTVFFNASTWTTVEWTDDTVTEASAEGKRVVSLFNDAGLILASEIYGTTGVLDLKKTVDYIKGEDGRIVEKSIVVTAQGKWERESRVEYTYETVNGRDQVVKATTYSVEKETGKEPEESLVDEQAFEYDAQGFLAKVVSDPGQSLVKIFRDPNSKTMSYLVDLDNDGDADNVAIVTYEAAPCLVAPEIFAPENPVPKDCLKSFE